MLSVKVAQKNEEYVIQFIESYIPEKLELEEDYFFKKFQEKKEEGGTSTKQDVEQYLEKCRRDFGKPQVFQKTFCANERLHETIFFYA